MNEDIYAKLRERVESVAGRKMISPRDFDFLAMRILDSTGSYIASVTLKRFWGYLGKEKQRAPFRHTLNILAQYAGYINYSVFCEHLENNIESDFLPNDSLQTNSLQKGSHVEIMWQPDRCITVQYEGLDMFKVVESINSKLSKGDTFFLNMIIDGEPLYLRCLVHDGASPTNYVCGRIGGVKYKVKR